LINLPLGSGTKAVFTPAHPAFWMTQTRIGKTPGFSIHRLTNPMKNLSLERRQTGFFINAA
jgi:hypothetical protein